jgi:signal transduction histidine kinase
MTIKNEELKMKRKNTSSYELDTVKYMKTSTKSNKKVQWKYSPQLTHSKILASKGFLCILPLLVTHNSVRLLYKIPLITGFTLILTVIVNIFAFQYFTESLLSEYLEHASQLDWWTNDPEKLQALLRIGTLDPKMQQEYTAVIDELSNLSNSLKNISANPELYISTGTWSSSEAFTINIWTGWATTGVRGIIETFANPRSFDQSSPEWQFIIDLLNRILLVNVVWLAIIVTLYFLWTRRLFSPIEIITEKLQWFIDTSHFTNISYSQKDEFFPLVGTINNLHRSLSIQENIRSNFLSDLSHEIRTPITAVKLYLEAIEDGVMTLDNKTVSLLQTELARLANITARIMEYENLAHDIIREAHVERFSVKKILSDIRDEYIPQLRKWEQEIVFDLPNDTMTRMDGDMFIQIVHNIFSNFIKYAWTGTTLRCKYEKTRKFYIFTFSDDWYGIPEDEINLVKEKFYRVDKWRTRDDSMSMGIWLSIIERIARLHGGWLEIRGNSPKWVIVEIQIER